MKRRIFFLFLIGLLLIVLMESLSYLLFWIKEGRTFSYSDARAEQKAIAAHRLELKGFQKKPKKPQKAIQVIHPYLGYVYNPEINSPSFIKGHKYPINQFGFIDSSTLLNKRGPDKIIIGIVGGSVAFWFSVQGDTTLTGELKKDERFRDREIVYVRLGLGGYKQPQQLLALNYVLALGGELDYLINIDGFNEVALPECENLSCGVHPFFPRDWSNRIGRLPDLELQLLAGEALYFMKRRRDVARAFLSWKTHYSVTLHLLWKMLDGRWEKAVGEAQIAIRDYELEKKSYEVTGPESDNFNENNLYPELAAVWKRCSVQLNIICEAKGIRYFHFLQPSQYVEGSKPMGPQEKRIAFSRNQPYRVGAEKGYPELRALADDLRAEGVNFTDMTMIFSGVEEPIYIDDCCHVNEKGNEIMARKIATVILGDGTRGDDGQ